MNIRIIGSMLIAFGFSCVGFSAAAAHKKEVGTLKNFMRSLDYMESELRYHKTPLPELCKHIAESQSGILRGFYAEYSEALLTLRYTDAAACMNAMLSQTNRIPRQTKELLHLLGLSLGKFDTEGQRLGISSVREEASKKLAQLCTEQEQRLRSYRILGVCAGAAIAILTI